MFQQGKGKQKICWASIHIKNLKCACILYARILNSFVV